MVFGGFVNGFRVDELLRFKPGSSNNLDCEHLAGGKLKTPGPMIRTSTASAYANGHFYVYGGQDDDNNKLGDMWDYNVATKTWSEVNLADGFVP
jgi:hypothetical protein